MFIVVFVRLSRFLTPISTPLPQVRMFMNKNHFSVFRKYAVRVRPWYSSIGSTQCRHCARTILRIMPSLASESPELVWNESNSSTDVDMTVSLVKFIVGPGVTSLSLSLPHWPRRATVRAVLSHLPNLCPSVTSFTPTVQCYHDDDGLCIVDIIRRRPHLQVLHTKSIFPCVMTKLASQPALQTLSLKTDYFPPEYYVSKLPDSIQTFSLDTSDPQSSLRVSICGYVWAWAVHVYR